MSSIAADGDSDLLTGKMSAGQARMSFDQQKRVLLCWLALLAPLPLPLNEPRPTGVVGWVFLGMFELAVLICLRRAKRDEQILLSNRVLNLLGLLYLPFFLVDLAASWNQFVTPMMHLALFALAVKLYALRQERDKWHAVFGIFFVFVTAMATSASVGIVVYLVTFLALWALVLARFSQFHMVTRVAAQETQTSSESRLLARVVPVVALAAIVLTIPIFVALPRLRNPYVLGRGVGTGAVDYAAGFSDEVSLDVIGRIRTNRDVALRARWSEQAPAEVRLVGAAYGPYRAAEKTWIRLEERTQTPVPGTGRFILRRGRVEDTVDIWLEPLGARSLVLPPRALNIELENVGRALIRSIAGTVSLVQPPPRAISYSVQVGVPDEVPPPPGEGRPELDLTGLTPAIADLARRVAGEGSPLQRAQSIERHLTGNYGYTLDFVGRDGEQPLEEFLFTHGSGHCELFASAMVLMLRAEGIPARFVTGFLGSEPSPMGYHIVRQGNAHAWVEAYLPTIGWRTFDPTPAAGRPGLEPRSAIGLARQAYDWVVFAFDRYVISYGVGDQSRVFERLTASLRRWLERLRGDGSDADRIAEIARPPASELEVETIPASSGAERSWWLVTPLALLLGILFFIRRPVTSARRAYVRLRRQARLRGLAVDDSVPPEELGARLVQRFPAAATPARRLVDLYLQESFAERRLSAEEIKELGGLLDETRRVLRKAS
ncbi:MAG TPA: transglutaminaseTgpA domain-containing protein [Thermoanaerobaculia bacterium]|nr:transglutaminaseTgpA domain-containing protein [Thermoanaerobaculia bacterium]